MESQLYLDSFQNTHSKVLYKYTNNYNKCQVVVQY